MTEKVSKAMGPVAVHRHDHWHALDHLVPKARAPLLDEGANPPQSAARSGTPSCTCAAACTRSRPPSTAAPAAAAVGTSDMGAA